MSLRKKNLDQPDEQFRGDGAAADAVDLGDFTVARTVVNPGWRWSTHMRPKVGGDWCQARHVGVVISGRFGVTMHDGTSLEFGPNDVYEVPPGHDGYAIGDQPAVTIEWTGHKVWTGFQSDFRNRILATLLMTDVVESTSRASEMGDTAWRDTLARHYEMSREQLERHGGREIGTTGDGMVALFDGAARALKCATSIRDGALKQGLHVRAGVHVGEVELVRDGIRGIAAHEVARIMSQAAPGEIFVSATTQTLARAAGLSFEERGEYELKGLPGRHPLFALTGDDTSS